MAGFPPNHRFANGSITSIRRMIGNAVPTMLAKAFFDECIKTLEEADGIQQQPQTVISLDEDDDEAEGTQQIIELDDDVGDDSKEIMVLSDDDEDDSAGNEEGSLSAEDGNSASTAWLIDD